MPTPRRTLAVAAALLAAAPLIPAQVHVLQPGEGLRFAQIDFTFPGATATDSATGMVSIDFQDVATASGIAQGYVNVATAQGWVVRNLPHDASLDFPGISWMFDLGSSGNVTTLLAQAEVSAQPVLAFAPTPATSFAVGDTEYNAQGVGAATTAAPQGGAVAAAVVFVPNPPAADYQYWQKGHHNVEQEVHQCHTAAVANSLQWLEDKTGIPIPHAHAPGAPGSNTLVGALDTASNRAANQPTPWADCLDGKLRYLDQNGLGDKFIVKHKNAAGGSRLPTSNRTVGSATSTSYDAAPGTLFDFVLAELEAGEDVELVVEWPDGSAHSVQVRGAGRIKGRRFISFNHDKKQGAPGGTQGAHDGGHEGFYIGDDGVTAETWLNKNGNKAKLSFAISESPWALPSPFAPSTPATPTTPTTPTGPGSGTVTTKPLGGSSNPANPETAGATTTSSGTVTVTTSDGRGLAWTPPVRVDQDPGLAPKATQRDSIAIGDQGLYVAWTDERFGAFSEQVYFNRSLDGGAAWSGEIPVSSFVPPGAGRVTAWRMAVEPGPLFDRIYVFLLADLGTGRPEPWLVVSRDSGASFSAPMPVGAGFPTGLASAGDLALYAHGDVLHLAWTDDRVAPGLADDVWYQRSDDTGFSFLPFDRLLDSSPPGIGFHDGSLRLRGNGVDFVAAAWTERRTSFVNAEIRMNSSMDLGDSWMAADVRVGDFDPFSANAFDMDLAVRDWGAFVIWDDNRTGTYEAYLAATFNGGVYFDPDLQLSSGGAESPSFARGEPAAAVFIGGGAQPQPMVCTTGDAGQSWRLPIPVGAPLTGQPQLPVAAWNPSYGKAIVTWRSDDLGPPHQYYGGVRPQHLVPVGSFSVGTPVHFEVGGFPWAEFGWDFQVACAGATGIVRLPNDGRLTGLRQDNILQISLAQPQLSGVLGAGGSGTTAPLVVPPTLAPGTTLWFLAASLAPGGGFGSLTEVVPVVIQ